MTTTTETELAGLGLTAEELRMILASAETRTFPKDATVIREGERSDSLYIILEGRVKAFLIDPAGQEAVLCYQGPGEYFGGKGFDDWPQSASIVAVEPSRFLVLPKNEFRGFLPRDHAFAARVFEKLVREGEEHARELTEVLQQKTAISEILRVISSSPTHLQSVLDAVAENVARLCDVTDAEIMRVEGDMLRLVAKHGTSRQWPVGTARLINRDWVTGRAVVDRTAVHVSDLQAAEADFPQGAAFAKQYGHRTTFATPLLREGAAIGAILIRRMEVLPLTDNQIALLKTFADQAAIAIENVRLFNEIQEKSRKVEEQAKELAEWNAALETRVAEQVAQIGQMSKLTRFLSPKVSDLIMSGEADDPLKTHRREITVVFVDLRGFTGFTETAEPEEVMSVLREYHAELGHAIMDYDGTIEHFSGDGVMILFNDPVPVANHELQAIRMALLMRDSVAALARGWRKRGYALGFGVGIAGGYATIGTIGFEGRLDYGAIGTVTNLAARLCGEATDGQILISPRIHSKIEAHIEAELVGELCLKGFHRPVFVHNVLRARPEGSE